MKYCPWCQDEPAPDAGEKPQTFWHLHCIRERNEEEGRYARDSEDGRLTEEIERLKRRRQLAYGKGETTAGTILTLQIGAMERARAVAFDGAGLTNDAW